MIEYATIRRSDVMELELLKLFYDYSTREKLVDEYYIDKFLDIVINEKELNNYVKNINIIIDENSFFSISSFEDDQTIASYNPFFKTIKVCEYTFDYLFDFIDKYDAIFYDEKIFYKNAFISQTLLHEIEHAMQEKIIDTENSDLSNILKYSSYSLDNNLKEKLMNKGYDNDSIIKFMISQKKIKRKNYIKNYSISPHERLAEINSYQEMINILSQIKEKIPNLFAFEKSTLKANMLTGFELLDNGFISSPTITYISNNGESNNLSTFDWYDKEKAKCLKLCKAKYNLDERIKLGLMIDSDELNELKK